MKFMKYLCTLVFAFCAFTSISKAQSVAFLGGGSSALFQEIGSATQSVPGVTCLWSFGSTTTPGGTPYFAFRDTRSGIGLDENGKIAIAWSPGGGTCAAPGVSSNIYVYMQLDSVVGDRCYFATDGSGVPGCSLIAQNTATVTGTSQVTTNPDTVTNLPAAIVTALAAAPHMFVAGTDIRPEDAKFAIQRAFTACNVLMPRQFFNQDSYFTTGLGYQTGNPNLGTQIAGNASFGGGTFNVVNFNITGNDPISGQAVPSYSVSTIGAQPVIVGVAPVSDANVAAMTDVNGFTLTLFYQGVLGRTSDLLGPTAAAEAVTVLVREPLSGTFNTFEYSVPNGTQYHASQEYGNCNGGGTVLSNPMAINSGNGVFGTASQRVRAIGTGNVTKFLNLATTPTIGYFFWSAGNAKGLTNTKYLKVNGIDPIQTITYDGVLPGNDVGHPLTNVNFAGLNAGNYPIWSALRLVGPPSNAGVAAMITALNVISSTQHDYIVPSNLNVWHSHFFLNGQSIPNPANGPTVGGTTLCSGGTAESGGDAGGTNMLISNNAHFCQDYGATNGLLNKTQ
jgi:hypothetical protein